MANPDFDALLNALVPFAQQTLQKHREFYPFAAAVGADGDLRLVSTEPESERPDSQAVINTLESGLQLQAVRGEIRASGICCDMRVVPPGQSGSTDAIGTRLEHKNGEAVNVFITYQRGFLNRYRYGDPFAAAGDRVVFV